MLNFIKGVFALIAGSSVAGANVGAGVTNGLKIAALIGAGGSVAMWFLENKDKVATVIHFEPTWAHVALIALAVWALVEIIHATRPPVSNRGPYVP